MWSGNLRYQFAKELQKLQEDGHIYSDEDLAANHNAITAFIDLLKIIDSNPDEEKFNAVKDMFFYLISNDEVHDEEILRYRLFKLTCELNSSQLVSLRGWNKYHDKIISEYIENSHLSSLDQLHLESWFKYLSEYIGHSIPEFIKNDASKLAELNLIQNNLLDNYSSKLSKYKLTSLGIKLCESLDSSFDS